MRFKGDLFGKDLDANKEEWDRREELLQSGGEIDYGVNWEYIDYHPDYDLQLPVTMRVSLRYNQGDHYYTCSKSPCV